MPIELRRAYLEEIRFRYLKSTKKKKALILDEFCKVSRYTRKYAIKVLNRKASPRLRKPGPAPRYNREVVEALQELSKLTGHICSKNMKRAIPLWLPFLKLPERTEMDLIRISSSTIDRLLRPYRKPLGRGLTTTQVSLMKSRIPIKLLDHDIKVPGFVEADTVSHCGNSAAGEFVSTVTATDLLTAWTENRAVWTKRAELVVERIKEIENSLPFTLIGFASDNGNEFLNTQLERYLEDRQAPVKFVRRRPYKKNDNAHVEQKNWTHVRQLFGYERYDALELVPMMNEIYQAYWNPLRNFFIPTMKLKSKTRIGGKIKKIYEEPKTPYQRVMESSYVSDAEKEKLRNQFLSKNPIYLKQQLDIKIKEFFKKVDELKIKQRMTAS